MKIICSSSVLKKAIEKAIHEDRKPIKKVTILHQAILFGSIKVGTEDNLIASYKDEFAFDFLKWRRVSEFLKQIPEQPVTLSIYDDSIHIECVACF